MPEVILGANQANMGMLKNLGMTEKKGQICIFLSWTQDLRMQSISI